MPDRLLAAEISAEALRDIVGVGSDAVDDPGLSRVQEVEAEEIEPWGGGLATARHGVAETVEDFAVDPRKIATEPSRPNDRGNAFLR
jgi:hypothetical protein